MPIVFCGVNWTAEQYDLSHCNITGILADDPQTSDTTVLNVPANDDSSSGQTDPNDNSEPDPADQDNDDKVPGHRIILVDRTGKEWDITHAVKRYGMEPKRFNFGLEPFAIQPLLNPVMLDPGVPGHPPDDEMFPVIGSKTDKLPVLTPSRGWRALKSSTIYLKKGLWR
jgi:hypothetical protein